LPADTFRRVWPHSFPRHRLRKGGFSRSLWTRAHPKSLPSQALSITCRRTRLSTPGFPSESEPETNFGPMIWAKIVGYASLAGAEGVAVTWHVHSGSRLYSSRASRSELFLRLSQWQSRRRRKLGASLGFANGPFSAVGRQAGRHDLAAG